MNAFFSCGCASHPRLVMARDPASLAAPLPPAAALLRRWLACLPRDGRRRRASERAGGRERRQRPPPSRSVGSPGREECGWRCGAVWQAADLDSRALVRTRRRRASYRRGERSEGTTVASVSTAAGMGGEGGDVVDCCPVPDVSSGGVTSCPDVSSGCWTFPQAVTCGVEPSVLGNVQSVHSRCL